MGAPKHERDALLLEFIRERNAAGTAPSYEEMMAVLGIKSKSGVHRVIHRLIGTGHLACSFAQKNMRSRCLSVIEQTDENRALVAENENLRAENAHLKHKVALLRDLLVHLRFPREAA